LDGVTRFLLVCLGGALGSGSRYLVALAAASLPGASFPWGTLAVNVTGSLLIGAAMEGLAPSGLRLFFVTGVLGGFTTYSSFNQETLQLVRSGQPGAALLNAGATLFGCLAAGVAGSLLVRTLR
jgi:CrcB protein